ncbi:cytochrome p450 52a11 [Diplodia corticola]|uniref:Cytochrome p450 52a11 n=1 Tax=Diplodia corticola TaxID=236234 RepID=A0A1J9RXZ5_9PEZI|nr:cytochrome p450 52a11 [Diplodia corticola]OJD37523.1 cytochrome p450 52a11 [Diplodia corticola]
MNHPPVVIADFRPFYWQIAIIASHDVCEQITKSSKTFPYSVPKSPTMGELLPLIGERSLLIAEDDTWKALRRTYNQGFAPTHLATLLPRIVEKTKLFLHRLDELAKSGTSSPMDNLCIDLTFDIIGAVVMDVDLNAQLNTSEQSALVRYYRQLISTYTDQSGLIGIPTNPFLTRRRKKLTKLIDDELKAIITSQHAEVIAAKDADAEPSNNNRKNRPRSVLALSLQADYASPTTSSSSLSALALQTTADTLKTFLFAGHDTTSVLLQWAFYELSRTPRALASLRAELASVFGPAATSGDIADALAAPAGDDALKKLAYTSAVIKETLRLYPPAGSARRAPPGAGLTVTVPDDDGETTKSVCLDGFVLYSCHFLVQRDPAVYGPDADEWVPERWLGDVDTSRVDEIPESGGTPSKTTTNKVPPGAWRPFERGPRNCIGQELANLEARVILAVAARRYDFVKVGAGEVRKDADGRPVLDDVKGRYEVVSPMFNTRQVTAKPFDGMVMSVKFHEQQA